MARTVFCTLSLMLCLAATPSYSESILSYPQALRLSADLLKTASEQSLTLAASSSELKLRLQQAEAISLSLEKALLEASHSLEISQAELAALRISYSEVVELSSRLQRLLKEQESLARSARVRDLMIGGGVGFLVGMIASGLIMAVTR